MTSSCFLANVGSEIKYVEAVLLVRSLSRLGVTNGGEEACW
jgi:hypothetical protein